MTDSETIECLRKQINDLIKSKQELSETCKKQNDQIKNFYMLLNKYLEAEREGRLIISPLAPGDVYFAVVRDCQNCSYCSSFYGMDSICSLDSHQDPHPFDGKYVKDCPIKPCIQERIFRIEDYNFVMHHLDKKEHIFLTQEEAEESIQNFS